MFASLAAALRSGGLFIFIAIATAAPVNEETKSKMNLRDLLEQNAVEPANDDKALDSLIGLRQEFRDRIEQSAGLY